MLPQRTTATRVVALALATAAIVPAAAVAKPADESFAAGPMGGVVSQDLVSPDARDAAGTSSSTGGVAQNLVSPDARDAGGVVQQSLVSPNAKDVAAGRAVGTHQAPAIVSDKADGGVDGWSTELVLALAASVLMGVAGIGLLARVRTRRPRAITLA